MAVFLAPAARARTPSRQPAGRGRYGGAMNGEALTRGRGTAAVTGAPGSEDA
ncbi:MAG TPA: hypothetical protein VFO46_18540 [Candidatus Sulfotelmatobacter sp.]|nr:hypothetical protein [Candidatus Sulfotelmatobacter sp.]